VPFTPTTSTTAGQQLVAQQVVHLLRGSGTQHPHPLAEPLDDLLRGEDTDVGSDEGRLDLLPHVLVDRVARQQDQQAAAE
jgi:hypothetical protein